MLGKKKAVSVGMALLLLLGVAGCGQRQHLWVEPWT